MSCGIKILTVILFSLIIVRVLLTTQLTITHTICIYHGKIIECCGQKPEINCPPRTSIETNIPNIQEKIPFSNETPANEIFHIPIAQYILNNCLYTGLSVECLFSLICLVLLLRWGKFYCKSFYKAIFCLAHFWVWFVLIIGYITSLLTLNIIEMNQDSERFGLSAAILDAILMTIFACAISFVARESIYSWIDGHFLNSPKWRKAIKRLYYLSLICYSLRNFSMFVYDTSLTVKSIGVAYIPGSDTEQWMQIKAWNSILLLFDVAFRASMARFFFAKIFQGRELPHVVDNEPIEIRGQPQLFGARDGHGGYQAIVPFRGQGEVDQANAHIEGYDRTLVIHSI